MNCNDCPYKYHYHDIMDIIKWFKEMKRKETYYKKSKKNLKKNVTFSKPSRKE